MEFNKTKEAREEAERGKDKKMQLSRANRMTDELQQLLKTLQHHIQNLSVQMDDIIKAKRIWGRPLPHQRARTTYPKKVSKLRLSFSCVKVRQSHS